MMNLHTSLALACVLVLTGCKKDPQASPQPPKEQPAKTPTKAPDKPADRAPDTPATAGPIPTAAELIALIDKATRIEAKSGEYEKPPWSKELTKEDIANLKAGIGEATLSAGAPRCLPTVLVTLYEQEKELAELGAFCDRGNISGPLRFRVGGMLGSLNPQDIIKVDAAIGAPSGKKKAGSIGHE